SADTGRNPRQTGCPLLVAFYDMQEDTAGFSTLDTAHVFKNASISYLYHVQEHYMQFCSTVSNLQQPTNPLFLSASYEPLSRTVFLGYLQTVLHLVSFDPSCYIGWMDGMGLMSRQHRKAKNGYEKISMKNEYY
ncbi:hypothetical protein, partial [Solemya velum gill symbiont]|uniref:hypothetical protein n=1 Tax=Solemya velum gill symbiont TaxID=2340 RepID=UPI001C4DDBF0